MEERGWTATKDPLHIKVEWIHDSHYCEDCGYSYASGVRILVNGEKVFELKPIASCFGGNDWTPEECFHEFLMSLGAIVESEYIAFNEDEELAVE